MVLYSLYWGTLKLYFKNINKPDATVCCELRQYMTPSTNTSKGADCKIREDQMPSNLMHFILFPLLFSQSFSFLTQIFCQSSQTDPPYSEPEVSNKKFVPISIKDKHVPSECFCQWDRWSFLAIPLQWVRVHAYTHTYIYTIINTKTHSHSNAVVQMLSLTYSDGEATSQNFLNHAEKTQYKSTSSECVTQTNLCFVPV